ncbi:hypothetical protein G6O43_24150 [Salmonella enterica subsp. enterica serovar 4:-:1,2]|jgi:hypothetical protein|nr:hypothetical protein [Salmonella enterica subsp. enterica serovar 4:-:1,2]
MQSNALKCRSGCIAARPMKLRRIEIREANLDPLIGVGGPADAKAIAIANVSHDAGELRSGPGWQRT